MSDESVEARCRHCGHGLTLPFADLGTAPPSNSYVSVERLNAPETYFPLKVLVCDRCWLVQTVDFVERDVFFSSDYAYFSSVSTSWLAHAEAYVGQMISRFGLDGASRIVEVASNDGYLLQYARKAGVPCYGIEPTHSTAVAARARGIEVFEEFFGRKAAARLRDEGRSADLMVANNVLAHVPEINDFLAHVPEINDFLGGFAILLKEQGVATFEFPHLMQLVAGCQFDTIYHEHYCYLSLLAVKRIAAANGLTVFDVEQLPTHGGSLRVFMQRSDTGQHECSPRVGEMLEKERDAGMETPDYYVSFQDEIHRIRDATLTYLIGARSKGLSVVAYGAAAKGNTLLNFCGVRSGFIDYVCDRAEAKQGRYMPGSRLPIHPPERIDATRPDRVLILPWNIRSEVTAQLAHIGEWGAKFVVAIPEIREFEA